MISPVTVLGFLFLMLIACYLALCVLFTVDFIIWLTMEIEKMAESTKAADIKPGMKTSEFWLVCGASISAFVTALAGGDKTGIISTGAVALVGIAGYLWTRHTQKMTAMKQPGASAHSVLP